MTKSSELVVKQLVNEGLVKKLQQRMQEVLDQRELPDYVREALSMVVEEYSTSDWQKMGALFALLWYKLDRITGALDRIQVSSGGSETTLRDVARSLQTIAQELKRR